MKRVSVRVKIAGSGKKTLRIKKGSTAVDLIKCLGLNRETVVVMINGRVCPEEETLKGGEDVEIVKVVTGG
ncbi:MAG: MoaD/ThiS family protein [Candidatus Hadarchaeales archaeon]